MDIKIGKFYKVFIIIFGLFGLLNAEQRLELRVVNRSNDSDVTTLSAGIPYTLEIKAEGAQDLYKCTIPGLENFHSEFCGASHLNLMSHITTVHSYVIRADKVGDFTIGPVKLVTKQGITITSNSLQLKVVEQQTKNDLFVELIFDKVSVVVGQKIDGVIRINSCVNFQLLDLQIPCLDKELGVVSRSQNHVQATRVIDGKNYSTIEFPITALFKKSGKFTLPKIGALCRVPNQKQQKFWGFGFSMHGSQDLWFYTKDLITLDVAALPPAPTNAHILGVGLFESVKLQCKQKKATRGEGVVAVLEIVGKEGVDDVIAPPLNLPSGLKYYDSKTACEKLSNGSYKKSCEYIIQATQELIFEIEPQVYHYFDIQAREFKMIKTKSISLEINGGKEISTKPFDYNEEVDTIQHEIEEKIAGLKTDGPLVYSPERFLSLPWFIFWILFIIFPFFILGLRNYRRTLGSEYWLIQKRKNAFKYTRKKLEQLKKNNNYAQLYDIFNQLFKDRCQLMSAQVTAQAIEERLKGAGFIGESLEQWNRFFLQLAELAYVQKSNKAVPEDLFNRALMWVNQLEEKL